MEKPLIDKAHDLSESMLDALGEDVKNLPEVLQTVFLVYVGHGVIGNGGFQYFYENDFPGQPSYDVLVAAFRRIGADEVAECIEETAAMFPFPDPHLHREERIDWMGSIEDEEDHEFHRLSDLACGHESVWPLLDEYLLKYRSFFDEWSLEDPK